MNLKAPTMTLWGENHIDKEQSIRQKRRGPRENFSEIEEGNRAAARSQNQDREKNNLLKPDNGGERGRVSNKFVAGCKSFS